MWRHKQECLQLPLPKKINIEVKEERQVKGIMDEKTQRKVQTVLVEEIKKCACISLFLLLKQSTEDKKTTLGK